MFVCYSYVLECANCGVIYRSRQHWYGNIDPEKANVIRTEIRHVWPGVSVKHGPYWLVAHNLLLQATF